MYAALTELEQWLTAASNWLTGAALVISLPLAAVYIGCMADALWLAGGATTRVCSLACV